MKLLSQDQVSQVCGDIWSIDIGDDTNIDIDANIEYFFQYYVMLMLILIFLVITGSVITSGEAADFLIIWQWPGKEPAAVGT